MIYAIAGANRFTAFTSGTSLFFFVQASNPGQATAAFLLFVLSQYTNICSIIANFSELGGPDASVLQAVRGFGNGFQAVLAAPLGVLLWRLTGRGTHSITSVVRGYSSWAVALDYDDAHSCANYTGGDPKEKSVASAWPPGTGASERRS